MGGAAVQVRSVPVFLVLVTALVIIVLLILLLVVVVVVVVGGVAVLGLSGKSIKPQAVSSW